MTMNYNIGPAAVIVSRMKTIKHAFSNLRSGRKWISNNIIARRTFDIQCFKSYIKKVKMRAWYFETKSVIKYLIWLLDEKWDWTKWPLVVVAIGPSKEGLETKWVWPKWLLDVKNLDAVGLAEMAIGRSGSWR